MVEGRIVNPKCYVDDCGLVAKVKGLCGKHYMRQWRHGDVNAVRQPYSPKGQTYVSHVPSYQSYLHMIQRCSNPNNHAYKKYGGRGIKICDRWLEPLGVGYKNFVSDMGERPEGTTLDRANNDGDYEPSNCRWADWYTQQNNRSNSRLFTVDGVTATAKELSKKYGIGLSTATQRIYVHKWPVERAFKAPVFGKGVKRSG